MRRHIAGLVAFLLASAVGVGLTIGYRQLGRHRVAGSTRQYSNAVRTWDHVRTSFEFPAPGLVDSWCSMYACSDGTRVFTATFTFASPDAAREQYERLVAAADGTPAIADAPERRVARRWLILREDAIRERTGSAYQGDSMNAHVRLEDDEIRMVLGPSITHISEFETDSESS